MSEKSYLTCPNCGHTPVIGESHQNNLTCPACEKEFQAQAQTDSPNRHKTHINNEIKAELPIGKYLAIAATIFLTWSIVIPYIQGPYKIIEANGTYRLNQRTGEVALIDGLNLRNLKSMPKPNLKEAVLTWPTQKIASGKMSVSVKTTWKEGTLYYNLVVTPPLDKFNQLREQYFATKLIGLSFQDENGFEMLNIPVEIQHLTQISDDDGQVGGYTYQGKETCSYEIYTALKEMNSYWNFEI